MQLGTDADISLGKMMLAHAAADPGRDAIVTEDRTISYGELVDRVSDLAFLLVERGFVPGETVGISVTDEIDNLTATLAAILLGLPQVNLPAHESEGRKRELIRRTGVKKVIADGPRSGGDAVGSFAPDFAKLSRGGSAGGHAQPFATDAPVVYRTTSGTTGQPKAFGLSARRIAGIVERQAADPSQTRVLRTSTMAFDSTRLHRIATILAGNTCMFLQQLAPIELARFCDTAHVTDIQMGTEKLKALALHPDCTALPPWTQILTGGSRVPGPLRRQARALTDALWISYATSEVGVISVASPDQHDAYPEGIGDLIAGVTVEILTENRTPVERGEVGRARIKKVGLPSEYLGGPDGGTSLADGWFYSNDLLSWPEGGPLVFHGRADDVMVLSGIKIFPSAIEDTLAAHPDVEEAVAYPVKSNALGDIPFAAVKLRPGATADAAELIRHCRNAIGIAYPRRVFILDAIPRTDTGKPLRRLLPVE